MQEYIRRKVEDEANMNAETFEGDSQMIDISYKNWKDADLQLHNLLQYIKNCGINLDEEIPEYHKTFPFGEINLN
jgi:hypothetical protein